jgi:hypothetical protein
VESKRFQKFRSRYKRRKEGPRRTHGTRSNCADV